MAAVVVVAVRIGQFLQGVEEKSRLIMQAKYGEAMRVPIKIGRAHV